MSKSALKYIQIRHWDYWWSVYQCGGASPACPNAVEFSLTDDREGKTLFFHFDLYNLSGLQDILRENTFIETDHPDHAAFLHKAKALERGEISYFIGALHYPGFMPDLAFCNQILTPECTLLELKAPPTAPYYAVLFLKEDRPLIPEVLNHWMTRLSHLLFGQDISFEMVNVPTRAEALESWQTETPHE